MENQLDEIRRKQAERLEQIRQSTNLKQIEFAAYLGIEAGSYSDIKRGKNGISRNILDKLEKKLSINLNWLLHGEGTMIRDSAISYTQNTNEVVAPYAKLPDDGVNAYIEKLFKMIEKKDEQIDRFIETIQKQNEQLANLTTRDK